MATIAAAQVDNGIGTAGVAYGDTKIYPVRVLDDNGVGQDSDIIAGIVAAADSGADVILMAFSSPNYSSDLKDAIEYAWSKGAVLVAATGNDGSNAVTVSRRQCKGHGRFGNNVVRHAVV